ncbi:MAG TPA: M20/M25/M40 family metallo-hydrolase, partial [Gammaproteobacteria bacterium]|nr:M20/M25/M40 family metallo-hydrolase [Gammaproteobacteria bacterium]
MDTAKIQSFANQMWDNEILQQLSDYIKIPNKSPNFDPDWEKHGYMDEVMTLASNWCKAQNVPGATVEVVKLKGRTPLLFVEVAASNGGSDDDPIILYGHLDKQPEFDGWMDGLAPWKPVIRDGKLYGRGGADDGYAVFSSLTAIKALQEQGIAHNRCVLVIECCEESGSYDLPHYIDQLSDRIGTPSLVVCLDAECGNYDQLWCTTSLRGNLVGELYVDVITEGVHSGAASGIVPSSFRVLRALLSRLEDETTGQIKVEAMNAEIPAQRKEQAEAAAKVLGDSVFKKFPWAGDTQPLSKDINELVLNNTWRAMLSTTGIEGIPNFGNAGNVQRPGTAVKLSFRLAPTTDAEKAGAAVKKLLETDPPCNAKVEFKPTSPMSGWNAPEIKPWLSDSMQRASKAFFNADAMYMGTGGSIPFMGLLG